MTVTFLVSKGSTANSSVLLDNVIIRISTNETKNDDQEEPDAEMLEKVLISCLVVQYTCNQPILAPRMGLGRI